MGAHREKRIDSWSVSGRQQGRRQCKQSWFMILQTSCILHCRRLYLTWVALQMCDILFWIKSNKLLLLLYSLTGTTKPGFGAWISSAMLCTWSNMSAKEMSSAARAYRTVLRALYDSNMTRMTVPDLCAENTIYLICEFSCRFIAKGASEYPINGKELAPRRRNIFRKACFFAYATAGFERLMILRCPSVNLSALICVSW